MAEVVSEDAAGVLIVIERGGEPDLTEFWERMPPVPFDSGRFLEEDR